MALDQKRRGEIEIELLEIADTPRSDLLELWQRLFKTSPGKNVAAPTLRRVIAYELQCHTNSGLNRQQKQMLKQAYRSSEPSKRLVGNDRHAEETAETRASRTRNMNLPRLTPGTQLVRNWNGRPYRVEIVKAGYVLDGKTYKSLSAVACKITGAHWSGPRFFGLKKAS